MCNIRDFCVARRPMRGRWLGRVADSERFSMPSWSITRRIAGAVCCVFSFLAASPTCAAEVAVDVGHTLAATGAVSARGRKEFDFNRVLAGRVVDALAARGLGVRPINFDGRIESLDARPRAAAVS